MGEDDTEWTQELYAGFCELYLGVLCRLSYSEIKFFKIYDNDVMKSHYVKNVTVHTSIRKLALQDEFNKRK